MVESTQQPETLLGFLCLRLKDMPFSLFPVDLDLHEIQGNIEKLTTFCSQHSWSVVYSHKKENMFQNKVITLYARARIEMLYYIFLHEIGHAWLRECDFTFAERYPELVRQPLRYATATYKIAKVQEEIEAWEVGKKLALNLGLRVNETKFEKIRAECLTSYMYWAGKPRKGRKTKYGHDYTPSTTDGSSDDNNNT